MTQPRRRIVLEPPIQADAGTCASCGAAVLWFGGPTVELTEPLAAAARVPFDCWPNAPTVTPIAGGRVFEVYGVCHWFTCDAGRSRVEALDYGGLVDHT